LHRRLQHDGDGLGNLYDVGADADVDEHDQHVYPCQLLRAGSTMAFSVASQTGGPPAVYVLTRQ
jgi:hypothetical protein